MPAGLAPAFPLASGLPPLAARALDRGFPPVLFFGPVFGPEDAFPPAAFLPFEAGLGVDLPALVLAPDRVDGWLLPADGARALPAFERERGLAAGFSGAPSDCAVIATMVSISFGVRSRQSPSARPLSETFMIRVRISWVTS